MTYIGQVKVAALGLVAAVALVAPAAYAQSPTTTDTPPAVAGKGHRGPGGPGAMAMRGGLYGQLDLTDAQKAQLQQIRANHRDAIMQLSKQLATMRQQLEQAENSSTTFNEDLATQQLTAMASTEAKLMGERFRERQESEAILTPDQKAKLQQLQQQMRANWGARRLGQAASSN